MPFDLNRQPESGNGAGPAACVTSSVDAPAAPPRQLPADPTVGKSLASWVRARRYTGSGHEVRLLCFPYAGASAQIFRHWRQWLAPRVELIPIELPGRGFQVGQSVVERMEELIDALANAIDPLLDLPLALFGHDIGALVAFELSRRLQATSRPPPMHLFVSAQRAPQLVAAVPRIHHLPSAQFIAAVRALSGAPATDLVDEELGDLLLPALRGDLKLSEDYDYRPGPLLDSPITVFAGVEDQSIGRHELEPWRLLTRKRCVLRWVAGSHCFIHEHQRLLAANVLRSLEMHPAPDTLKDALVTSAFTTL